MLHLNFKEFISPQQLSLDIIPIKTRLKTVKEWLCEMAHSKPDCPQCGSPMVIRTAKTGQNAGNKFYGCSRFPDCKGSMRYDPVATPTIQKPVPVQAATPWIYASLINPSQQAYFHTKVAVQKQSNGDWKFLNLHNPSLTGIIPADKVQSSIKSYRDKDNKPYYSNNPTLKELDSILNASSNNQNSNLISDKNISAEQTDIDKRFAELMENPGQSHLMINALAGTGKTTMLKHLAWKYGKPEQKWLYLVFNTKNKVEATEKFPNFVQVRTTNGFLGEVLKDKKNFTKIPQTERMVNISKFDRGEESSGILEKARLMADSKEFAQVMEKFGIPEKEAPSNLGSLAKTINSLLKSIRYQFKEQVLTLSGLAKSFALDPRKDLEEGLNKVMDKYDFDTELSEVKERISKYSGSFRANVIHELENLLGYDFMEHNYIDGIKNATKWLMEKSMPSATSQSHKQGSLNYNLGQFRDFNDDLWYAAVHADEINWPRYDVVLADEVQDFNESQKIMLKKLHDSGAKIVAVGDPNQSLYRFRGADADAFGNISDMLGGLSHKKDIVKPLSSNFRSRKAILDFSNEETHVKNLRTGKKFDDGNDGTVTKNDVHYDDAFSQLSNEQKEGKLKETAFIARTNEPLVHAALKLLTNKVPFIIVGKDIAKDLKKHIGKIVARFRLNDYDHVNDLAEQLENFKNEEGETHLGKSTKKVYLQELEEVTNALLSALGQFSNESSNSQSGATIAQFKQWLSQRLGGLDVEESEKDLKIFKEKMKEKPVVLTTSHKAKGLEFSRVYILRYDLFPHKKAKRPEDLEQEANSKYVALTRAQDELHVLKLDGQPGYIKK